ncbi:MAG: hypothetical protein KDN19_18680 [Verrucomicrobiae bacterium]|nr:hypothetical protein [Verrucomicrobiae bacterium]
MTLESQSLEFSPTPAALAAGGLFVAVVIGLAILAWQRSGWRGSVGGLELLRVLIAVAIAITLLQPEWRETFRPESKPVLTVLTDVSGSMETADVLDPAAPEKPPRSRAEIAAPLGEAAAWNSLSERMDVAIESFSSNEKPAKEATDLNAALAALPEKHPQLAAVVLVGDGDWNAGQAPSAAATRLRMRNVPVFAVPTGSSEALPDVEISSFEVPVFAIAGKPLRIPFTLTSTLPREETVTLELHAPGGETITQTANIPAMGKLEDSIVWRPSQSGEAKLALEVPQAGAEVYLQNNTQEATLDIRKEELRVLIIETYPRWEYRYLRNALERDPGVEVECLLFHPDLGKTGAGRGYLESFPSDEQLTGYDVVFLGDVGLAGNQLSDSQLEQLRLLVRDQASGLVFLPGLRGYESTFLNSPRDQRMPVACPAPHPPGRGTPLPRKLVMTGAGRSSLLTKLEDTDDASAETWNNLPGFHWYAPALRAKVGTEVLATHGTESTRYGRVPLIVTRPYGAGKILFMGTDGAWRWRKAVEDKYHYRFWGQVVRWMAYQRNMASGENMRLFYTPDRPKTGEALTLNANVMSATGEPLRDGAVIAQISAPSGKVSSLRLAPAGEEAWGLFTGTFTPEEAGAYQLRLTCAEAGAPLETTIPIQGTTKEKRGRPARLDVLEEIAQLTRGEVLESSDVASVVSAIAALPEPDPEQRRLPLWSHPAWAGFIVLLMGVFWAGRKGAGLF